MLDLLDWEKRQNFPLTLLHFYPPRYSGVSIRIQDARKLALSIPSYNMHAKREGMKILRPLHRGSRCWLSRWYPIHQHWSIKPRSIFNVVLLSIDFWGYFFGALKIKQFDLKQKGGIALSGTEQSCQNWLWPFRRT